MKVFSCSNPIRLVGVAPGLKRWLLPASVALSLLGCGDKRSEESSIPSNADSREQNKSPVKLDSNATHNSSSSPFKGDDVSGADHWKLLLAERPDLDNSDQSKIKYIRELIVDGKFDKNWDLVRSMIALLDDKAMALELVSEVVGIDDRQAVSLFELVANSCDKFEEIADYVSKTRDENLRSDFATKVLANALNEEDASRLLAIVKRMAGGEQEEAKYLKKIADLISIRWWDRFNREKSDYSPEFIDEVARSLPPNLSERLRIGAAIRASDNLDTAGVISLSDAMEVPVDRIIQGMLLDPVKLASVSSGDAMELIRLMPTEGSIDAICLNTLVKKTLANGPSPEVLNYLRGLPEPQKELVIPKYAVRIAVDSGRQSAYDFASALDQSDLSFFLLGLERVWDDTGGDGPSLEDFRNLRK